MFFGFPKGISDAKKGFPFRCARPNFPVVQTGCARLAGGTADCGADWVREAGGVWCRRCARLAGCARLARGAGWLREAGWGDGLLARPTPFAGPFAAVLDLLHSRSCLGSSAFR